MAVKQFRRPYDYTPGQTKEVIQGEQHTIPMSPPYDIYLIHIPRKETPSTVRIPGFTEVDGPPSPGQYRVHYEEPGSDPLGRVEFHASDAGKLVAVDYHACGTVIWGEDRGDGRPNIAELQETLEGVQGGVDALREAVGSLEEASGISYESGVSGFAPENVKAALDALAGVRIVEMGSNSNGEYVRWENGLQVCWASRNLGPTTLGNGSLADMYRTDIFNHTFPAVFTAPPGIGFAAWREDSVGGNVVVGAICRGITKDVIQYIQAWAGAMTDSAIYASWIAIGRWK